MADKKDGGQAFPAWPSTLNQQMQLKGMTLRDYFAAKVAAGDAAADKGWSSSATETQLSARAEFYYRLADAMLKAREE